MLILGIESSCDDTGVALVNDGKNIIHNISTGSDVESTRMCLMNCGIKSERNNHHTLE